MRKWHLPALGLFLLAVLAAAADPITFQKAVLISEGKRNQNLPSSGKALDLSPFLRSIPYGPELDMVYAVEPASKYRRTILEGHGNCSNLIFGAAYHLDRSEIDYQIVHVLPTGFLEGRGHTLIRTRYSLNEEVKVGVVDVLAAGVPSSQGEGIDIAHMKGAVPDFSMLSLALGKDDTSRYFGSYLDESHLGYLYADDVARYFRFIEAVYVPILSERLEKLFYEGLALLVGVSPRIYVDSVSELFSGNRHVRYFYICILWILRISAIVLPVSLVNEAYQYWTRSRLGPEAA